MAEDKGQSTLNEIQENSVIEDGVDSDASFNQGGLGDSSSPDDKPQIDPEGDNEENTVQDASETEVTEKKPEEDASEKPGEKELSGEEDRFDKHPRFQELNTQNKDLTSKVDQLTGMLQTMKDLMPAKGAEKEAEPNYEDVTGKTQEELQDWFDEDAKGFMSNFAKQVQSEVLKSVNSTIKARDTESDSKTSIQGFAERNPDFLVKWNAGEIQQVINTSPQGFHNPISAYYELTSGTREQSTQDQIKEAVAKAIKETEEKVTKNFKAKRKIVPLDAGAAPKNSVDNEDLRDTKKQGGLVAAIAQRLLQGRAA